MLKRAPFVALLLVLVAAGTALAGGPNKSSNSSITLVLTQAATTTTAPTTGPAFGDIVTFAVSTDVTTQPFVHLKCWQNQTLVLQGWQGFFATALGNHQFVIGPTPAWPGGVGTCTAYLENWDSYSKNGRITTLASTSFDVTA